MTDIAVGLPVVCLVAFILGAGWAAVFHKALPYGAMAFVCLAWTCGIVTTSVAWAWVYPFNGDVRVGAGTTLGLALVGYAIACLRGSFWKVDINSSIDSFIGLGVSIAITVIALVPAVANVHLLSVGQRIGPDEIGYAISADALGSGLTQRTVQHNLAADLEGGTVQSALTPKTEQVDKIPSLTTQVQNEFLTGADRWGMAGAAGTVVYALGRSHLWSTLSLLSALAFLTTCTALWVTIRSRYGSSWAALVAVVLFGLSPSVLNAWHEGGLAQIWVMPMVFLLALPILRLQDGDRSGALAATGLGVAGMLPAYNSDLLASVAIFALAMLFSIRLLRRQWWASWWPIGCGALCGAAVTYPSTSAFAVSFVRSVSENGSAGWPLPRWPSLADLFGLSSIYDSASPQVDLRGPSELVSGGIESALVGAVLVAMVYRARLRTSVVLLASVATFVLAVYLDSRYLSRSSNYQYFKTIAALAPAGALGVGALLAESLGRLALPDRSTSPAGLPSPRWLWAATIAVTACVSLAGVTYVVTYRRQGSVVPVATASLSQSSSAQALFARYNIVAPRTLAAYSIGAEVDLNWIGRYNGDPPTHLARRIHSPVALMILEVDCPGFRCLARVEPSAVILRKGGVGLVRLSPTSEALAKLPEADWPDWVSTRYSALGGGQLAAMRPLTQPSA